MKGISLNLKKRKIYIDESLFIKFFVKPLFLLFIYFGFYSRTEGLFGVSGGKLSVIVSFSLFLFAAFHFLVFNKKNYLSNFTWFISIFFVVSGILPLFTAFIFDADPVRILRFSMEIGITYLMFFSVYYFIREGIISPRFFMYALAILGFIASVQLLTNLIGALRVQRLRGMSGSNYLGSSYAIAAFAWVIILYSYHNAKDNISNWKKYLSYFCFFITVLALLLTGTRAAAIAFVVGIMLFQIFGMQSKKFTKYLIGAGILFVGVILTLSFYIDLSLLWNRYSISEISRMASIRFNIYAMSVTDLTLIEFLFGRPDFYLFSESDSGVNPHNLFLAIIRYNGLIPFILFMIIFFMIINQYFKIYILHRFTHKYRYLESTIIILFVMILIYTVFSGGRITRSFAFYIIMGYTVGYFELFSNLKSYDEYKKLLF